MFIETKTPLFDCEPIYGLQTDIALLKELTISLNPTSYKHCAATRLEKRNCLGS